MANNITRNIRTPIFGVPSGPEEDKLAVKNHRSNPGRVELQIRGINKMVTASLTPEQAIEIGEGLIANAKEVQADEARALEDA